MPSSLKMQPVPRNVSVADGAVKAELFQKFRVADGSTRACVSKESYPLSALAGHKPHSPGHYSREAVPS